MLVRMMHVLDPVERLLDEIERTGAMDAVNGTPVFHYLEKTGSIAYQALPAVDGVAGFFEMFCTRRGSGMELAGIRQFAKRLEYGM